MAEVTISNPSDPRIEVFQGLRDQAARQRRERPGGDMAGYFIAEGDLVIERAVHHDFALESVLIADRRTKPLPEAVGDATVFRAGDEVLSKITGRPELRDPIACFVRPTLPSAETLIDGLESNSAIAVLVDINNPNNLGVIMRNAAGLGIDAVLLDPTCGDPLYRRAIRASMGQVFALPHARISALPESLDMLHDAGIETIALSPFAATDLRSFDASDKTALLLGAEGPGLPEAAMRAATHRVRISMSRDVDSLNVANAAAIAFHHLGK